VYSLLEIEARRFKACSSLYLNTRNSNCYCSASNDVYKPAHFLQLHGGVACMRKFERRLVSNFAPSLQNSNSTSSLSPNSAFHGFSISMEQFVYRPPSRDNGIRILRLKPATSFEAPLHGSLIDGHLSRWTRYEALSYVWGAPTGDRRLICDGSELLITSNCELALRHLRLKWKSRSLWVDSVCIDQKSISDRNQQVKQMGEIYRKATTVLVWLGRSDDQTKAAFARWRKLEKSYKPLGSSPIDHLQKNTNSNQE
jgi:hypothetical protein